MRDTTVAGIDIGGTLIKGALYNRDRIELARAERPTPTHSGTDKVMAAIIGVLADLRSAVDPESSLEAVGVAVAGLVDAASGTVLHSVNIGWRNVPLARLLSQAVGTPVAIEHDVRAAGMAEIQLGAGQSMRDVLFVAVGTGIAGAVFSNGHLVHGSRGMAGEIGHLPVVPAGEKCVCGQRGCTEAYASASAIARRYIASGGADIPAEEVLIRAEVGERLAQLIVQQGIDALATALVSFILTMDPERIIVGGGFARAGEAVLVPLRRAVADGLAWRDAPEIVGPHFSSDAGRQGAALVAWNVLDGAP